MSIEERVKFEQLAALVGRLESRLSSVEARFITELQRRSVSEHRGRK